MKPGYKSTELFVCLAGILVPILNRKLSLQLDQMEVASMLGLAATYIAGRSWLKARPAASAP